MTLPQPGRLLELENQNDEDNEGKPQRSASPRIECLTFIDLEAEWQWFNVLSS